MNKKINRLSSKILLLLSWIVIFVEKALLRFSGLFSKYRSYLNNRSNGSLGDGQKCVTFVVVPSKEMILDKVQVTIDAILRQTSNCWNCIIDHKLATNMDDPRFVTPPVDFKEYLLNYIDHINGEYLVFLHAGDCISPQFIEIICSYKGDIIYYDQEVVRGKKHEIFLKPEWSPELWLSVDVLYSFALRIDYLKKIKKAGSINGFVSVIFSAEKITHIPKVLVSSSSFPWEILPLRREHANNVIKSLAMLSLEVSVSERSNGSLSFCWKEHKQKISIIIPNRDCYDEIHRCINSLYSNTDYPSFEVIIVDDFSRERNVISFYSECAEKKGNIFLMSGISPFNFSRACNQGAAKATGDLLLFLNNDTEIIDPDWLTNLAGVLQIPGVGVVGPKLLYPDGSVQHAGIVIGLEGHASHVFMGVKSDIYTPYGYVDWMRNVSAVTGACMMVRRDVFEKVGGFDESLTLAFGDVDLCLRIIDAGYRIVYTPDVQLIHYEGRSRGKYIPKQDFLAKKEYFREKIRQGDPYYNPNLSRAWRIPTIRQRWEMDPVYRYDKIIEFKTR